LWYREDFHWLGVQGAKVSAFPVSSPHPSVSLASQQGPWYREFTLSVSVSVSQPPFWISLNFF
jgi:hypothetical protein